MNSDPSHDYTEKELDDAMAYLDSTRRKSSLQVPSWARQLSANLSSSYRLVDRKLSKSFLPRRALLLLVLVLIALVTVVTSLAEEEPEQLSTTMAGGEEKGMLDAVVKAPARLKGAVKELGSMAWDKAHGVEKEIVYKGLDQLHVSRGGVVAPRSMRARES